MGIYTLEDVENLRSLYKIKACRRTNLKRGVFIVLEVMERGSSIRKDREPDYVVEPSVYAMNIIGKKMTYPLHQYAAVPLFNGILPGHRSYMEMRKNMKVMSVWESFPEVRPLSVSFEFLRDGDNFNFESPYIKVIKEFAYDLFHVDGIVEGLKMKKTTKLSSHLR